MKRLTLVVAMALWAGFNAFGAVRYVDKDNTAGPCDGAQRYGLRIEGYCLMTNHVHVVGVPEREGSLALALGLANLRYAQYVNRMQGRSGRLWQNRFFSCALDDAHRVAALCYIENNPARAGMVKRPEDYAWSSAGCHCGGADPSGLLAASAWGREYPGTAWRRVLAE